MTLGHVYDMDLRKNENLIKEVIIQAQGEVSTFMSESVFQAYALQDGPRGVHSPGQGNLDKLYARIGQLPEQMPPDQVNTLLCSMDVSILT